MVALWNRADHYIFIMWFLLLLLLSFFPRLISTSWIGCLTYFHTWYGLSANLRCTSETCCMGLTANTACKKILKNLPSGHHCTTLSGYSFATKARIDSRKKLGKQQYLLHMSPQYGKLRPTSGCDRSGSLRHPSKFQRVSHLGSITAAMSLNGRQPNFARCLAVSWAGTLIYIFGGSCSLRNFSRCKIHFASSKSCALVFW